MENTVFCEQTAIQKSLNSLLEKIDELKAGDTIDVFYDEDKTEDDPGINRLIQFIDKGKEPFYIKGNIYKIGGMAIVACGCLLLIGLVYLKKKGKIG